MVDYVLMVYNWTGTFSAAFTQDLNTKEYCLDIVEFEILALLMFPGYR